AGPCARPAERRPSRTCADRSLCSSLRSSLHSRFGGRHCQLRMLTCPEAAEVSATEIRCSAETEKAPDPNAVLGTTTDPGLHSYFSFLPPSVVFEISMRNSALDLVSLSLLISSSRPCCWSSPERTRRSRHMILISSGESRFSSRRVDEALTSTAGKMRRSES